MNEEITVRGAQSADSGSIAKLMRQPGYPATVSEVEERLKRLSSLDTERIIAAEHDGRIVGIPTKYMPCRCNPALRPNK